MMKDTTSNGNILISFQNGVMKVDYSGDRNSMFGLNDVDILRANLALEGMFCAQTGMDTPNFLELLDDERKNIDVHENQAVFDMEEAVIVKEDGTPDPYGGQPPFTPESSDGDSEDDVVAIKI